MSAEFKTKAVKMGKSLHLYGVRLTKALNAMAEEGWSIRIEHDFVKGALLIGVKEKKEARADGIPPFLRHIMEQVEQKKPLQEFIGGVMQALPAPAEITVPVIEEMVRAQCKKTSKTVLSTLVPLFKEEADGHRQVHADDPTSDCKMTEILEVSGRVVTEYLRATMS
jgi:hypothetical protein